MSNNVTEVVINYIGDHRTHHPVVSVVVRTTPPATLTRSVGCKLLSKVEVEIEIVPMDKTFVDTYPVPVVVTEVSVPRSTTLTGLGAPHGLANNSHKTPRSTLLNHAPPHPAGTATHPLSSESPILHVCTVKSGTNTRKSMSTHKPGNPTKCTVK